MAILEEIEARSNLMSLDEASVDRINALDLAFLSSVGGADVDLFSHRSRTELLVVPILSFLH